MKNYENAIDNRYEFVLLFDVECIKAKTKR